MQGVISVDDLWGRMVQGGMAEFVRLREAGLIGDETWAKLRDFVKTIGDHDPDIFDSSLTEGICRTCGGPAHVDADGRWMHTQRD